MTETTTAIDEVMAVKGRAESVLTRIEGLLGGSAGELPAEAQPLPADGLTLPEGQPPVVAVGEAGAKGKELSPLDQLAVLQSTIIPELQGALGLLQLDMQELQKLPEMVRYHKQQIDDLRHEVENPNIDNFLRAVRRCGYSESRPEWMNSL